MQRLGKTASMIPERGFPRYATQWMIFGSLTGGIIGGSTTCYQEFNDIRLEETRRRGKLSPTRVISYGSRIARHTVFGVVFGAVIVTTAPFWIFC